MVSVSTAMLDHVWSFLPAYRTFRQSCLNLCQPGIRDLRAAEVERCQTGHPFQVHQPGIRDLREVEDERYQTGHPFQVLQPGIRDLRVDETKRCQAGHPFQVLQPSIRDLRPVEVELCQTGQVFQVLQPGVRDRRVCEVDFNNLQVSKKNCVVSCHLSCPICWGVLTCCWRPKMRLWFRISRRLAQHRMNIRRRTSRSNCCFMPILSGV